MTAFSWRCAFRTFAFAGVAIPFLFLPAAAQTRGGILKIGIEQQVVGFDPVITKTTAYQTVMAGGIISAHRSDWMRRITNTRRTLCRSRRRPTVWFGQPNCGPICISPTAPP